LPSPRIAPASLTQPAAFVAKMQPALDRAKALLDGTDAMRAAGEKFLPKFPGEHAETYKFRLASAVLNNFYDAIAGLMVGMVFEKALTHEKHALPAEFLANVDNQGRDLNTFAAELCRALLTKGRPHILIDHPKKPKEAVTAADDAALGLRPYLVLMEPGAVISAYANTESGVEVLENFRWREWSSEPDDDGYGLVPIERIRVFRRSPEGVAFEVWERQRQSDQFVLDDEGVLTRGGAEAKAMTAIPIVTLYSDRQSFMVAKPTLDDIAHKNIEHWQSSADQRHILTVTRFPILYQIGTKNPVALIGPYSMLHTETPQTEAKIGYAEATGTGTEHGWKDLARIVAEAEAMTVRIVTSDGAKSDTGEKADVSKEASKLQKVAAELDRGLTEALRHAARWYGLDDKAGGIVTTHKEFGVSADDVKAIDQLRAMRDAGDLSQQTYWKEVDERGLFKTTINFKTEATLIDDEKDRALERQISLTPTPTPDDEDDDDAKPPKAKVPAAA
jgi:hypothetical protein